MSKSKLNAPLVKKAIALGSRVKQGSRGQGVLGSCCFLGKAKNGQPSATTRGKPVGFRDAASTIAGPWLNARQKVRTKILRYTLTLCQRHPNASSYCTILRMQDAGCSMQYVRESILRPSCFLSAVDLHYFVLTTTEDAHVAMPADSKYLDPVTCRWAGSTLQAGSWQCVQTLSN